MTIQETSFVFKREGEQFKMSEAHFSNGSRFKSPKVATAVLSFLAQTPERDKVSQCQELQVTLDPSALPLLTIQSRENGLDITVNGAAMASLAGEISSCSQKPEIVRQFLKELQEKDSVKTTEAQNSLKTLMDRVERLLNSDDPIVERVLDHILAQREAFSASPDLSEKMNQLDLEVDAVLRHLEIRELRRNFGVAEVRLVGS
ncbi:MAG TPA: hypothetical protein VIJ14_04040, partial [Rhabdochlamydiaceae bacterium]